MNTSITSTLNNAVASFHKAQAALVAGIIKAAKLATTEPLEAEFKTAMLALATADTDNGVIARNFKTLATRARYIAKAGNASTLRNLVDETRDLIELHVKQECAGKAAAALEAQMEADAKNKAAMDAIAAAAIAAKAAEKGNETAKAAATLAIAAADVKVAEAKQTEKAAAAATKAAAAATKAAIKMDATKEARAEAGKKSADKRADQRGTTERDDATTDKAKSEVASLVRTEGMKAKKGEILGGLRLAAELIRLVRDGKKPTAKTLDDMTFAINKAIASADTLC